MVNNELCNVTTSHFAANPAYYITESGTITDCGPLFRTITFPGVASGELIDGQTC